MEAPREKEGPSRVPWNIRGIEHPLVKPVHQSLLVEENVAPRLCGGEKKPRELIIYVFHTALIFPLPSKIFEESAGFYLVGDLVESEGSDGFHFVEIGGIIESRSI